jgi:hypothetical protein
MREHRASVTNSALRFHEQPATDSLRGSRMEKCQRASQARMSKTDSTTKREMRDRPLDPVHGESRMIQMGHEHERGLGAGIPGHDDEIPGLILTHPKTRASSDNFSDRRRRPVFQEGRRRLRKNLPGNDERLGFQPVSGGFPGRPAAGTCGTHGGILSDPPLIETRVPGHTGRNPVSLWKHREDSMGRLSVLKEFWGFLRVRKKLWLTPIVAMLVLLGALILFTSSSVAPFIYTLF